MDSNLICLITTGRRKIHYTFSDKELVEEYDLQSGLLLGKV